MESAVPNHWGTRMWLAETPRSSIQRRTLDGGVASPICIFAVVYIFGRRQRIHCRRAIGVIGLVSIPVVVVVVTLVALVAKSIRIARGGPQHHFGENR